MPTSKTSAPPPDLRILPIESIIPHEEHDSQRSEPLLRILDNADYLTNPPVVAPMGDGRFVVMDGANRYHCFKALGYPHLLVQVADYKSAFVELGVWNHIISDWELAEFVAQLHKLPDTSIVQEWDYSAVAQILLKDGTVLALDAPTRSVEERNHALRRLVQVYQRRAKLNRSAHSDPALIWPLFPDALAVVLFPHYEPADIIAAAKGHAYLPPGVSRHIINGRALKLYYPLAKLSDMRTSLEAKNAELQDWVRHKMANRAVRYYAESTYQFDE